MKKLFTFASVLLLWSCGEIEEGSLSSPDGNYQFDFSAVAESLPTYSVMWQGEQIVGRSAMGFVLQEGDTIPKGYTIKKILRGKKDEVWEPLYGEQDSYRDNYNEMLLVLANDANDGLNIRVRAYNEGVAFRYEFPEEATINIASELSQFAITDEATVWVSNRAQSYINKVKLADLKDAEYERPLLAQLPSSHFVALGEAALIDFARMKFKRGEHGGLAAALSENVNDLPTVVLVDENKNSPWRYIMAGESASEVVQNNGLILNLNEPCALEGEDLSWIKPGKVLREMSLCTVGAKITIDFAKRNNFQYILFDGGWYGYPHTDESDALTVTPYEVRSAGPLDIEEVVKYGKESGVDVILYADKREIIKKDKAMFDLYSSWGITGFKYGFVNVGSQYWTAWLHNSVKEAAARKIQVNIHDEYRPTGLTRTYPYMLTVEGIRGDEESVKNESVLKTLFTRMIAGAGDQTICYLSDRVEDKMGSRASQMAKSIIIYSPWHHIYWYDRPENVPTVGGVASDAVDSIKENEETEFFAKLPTVWNESKIIDGYPGEFGLVARRSGDSWYVGGLVGDSGKVIDVDFSFLSDGASYEATIYSDNINKSGAPEVVIKRESLKKGDILPMSLKANNGFAIILDKK
ncbi:MAG: glycoside hydrolase family 97 N-terminal domain-containing protein [Rikenellaceae bacterium]